MTKRYVHKKQKHKNLLYTMVTAVLICTIFLGMIGSLYNEAEEEAYEMLHIQTKQIKDDLILQIKSDRENLITMANFAAKLYADGEGYGRMFNSFKPIGMFSNIGILNPDNTFVTSRGTVDLNGKISFEEEAARGEYISGRIPDLTISHTDIVRSAVPIVSDGKTVGMLYGVIKLKTINEKYGQMAKDLDAQLFVYDKENGNFVIDSLHRTPGNLGQLKDREYNDGYSYEDLITTDKGFSSFKSIYKDEDMFVHYSTIEDFDWGIILGRYESQVFAKVNVTSAKLFNAFFLTALTIAIYILFVLNNERRNTRVTAKASKIRKLLLDINQQYENIFEALKNVMNFAASRSAFFADTDGEDYHYIASAFKDKLLCGDQRKYFVGELFQYSAKIHNTNVSPVGIIRIKADTHLQKRNEEFYNFLKDQKLKEITFATITDRNNHVSILGVINPKKRRVAMTLLEDIAVCFSIAIFNKKHLNKTEVAAVTDSLTGVPNRVSYKRDVLVFDQEKPEDFSCIYVDVNELHIRNNKYGHAAGDEMLIYIANTLKEVFYGHHVYRMGGDEFLVFVRDTEQEHVKGMVDTFIETLKATDYNVAMGMSYRKQNTNCEEMVREAELRMYEAKAQYYQNKEQLSISRNEDNAYTQVKTGIMEIDTILSILKEHYNGIYRVNLDTDSARRILMPAYLGYNEYEDNFSKLMGRYIEETVHPDFHRPVSSFMNYNAVKRQLIEGKTPRVTYKKMNGEFVVLSIYALNDNKNEVKDTLWVFSRG